VVKEFDERLPRRVDFSLEKFNVTLDCSQPIGALVDSMQGNTTSEPLRMVLGSV